MIYIKRAFALLVYYKHLKSFSRTFTFSVTMQKFQHSVRKTAGVL